MPLKASLTSFLHSSFLYSSQRHFSYLLTHSINSSAPNIIVYSPSLAQSGIRTSKESPSVGSLRESQCLEKSQAHASMKESRI